MIFITSRKSLIVTCLLLIFQTVSLAQKLDPKGRNSFKPDHIINSDITNKSYLIHMSFPKNYSVQDSITYPVLYVLDGKSTFGYFESSYIDSEKIEDVILVGISHKVNGMESKINRFNDYTPYRDTITERRFERKFGVKKGTIKTGGADKFLECLKKEIVPFIDKYYKTNSDRGISGHSLGGLFTSYCFLNSDNYFTRFGINSPSFQLNEDIFLKPAIIKFTDNQNWDIKPTKVFISTGENESPMMVSNMIKFSLYLKKNNYEHIDLNWRIYRNENHTSVIPFSLNGTLKTLYEKK
ncbi:alpha/beta hydrolase-fold protein [uncultured Psychroserpens sp.]|uniref:alpha/beta hydrolase n=1 Tax=uncultured Psychroserpens sp. TaxID=255436 RepID=UPI002626BA8F|nr:alpha/beta hydrolase-fold protein [uncultured Psychroserpens sp.]